MPNIAKMLKDEIQRIAKHEIKQAITTLRRDNIALKRMSADLKRRLAQLESINKRLVAKAEAIHPKVEVSGSDETKARITGKIIRSIRSRLGLSQNAFAKLVGVSSQAVIKWEHKDGRLKFRGDTKQRIVAIRNIGKREAISFLQGIISHSS